MASTPQRFDDTTGAISTPVLAAQMDNPSWIESVAGTRTPAIAFAQGGRLNRYGNPETLAPAPTTARPVASAEVIFGGFTGDTTRQISAAQANGKFVVLLPSPPTPQPAGGRGAGFGGFGFGPSRFAGAVAVATISLDSLTPSQRAALASPNVAALSTTGAAGRFRRCEMTRRRIVARRVDEESLGQPGRRNTSQQFPVTSYQFLRAVNSYPFYTLPVTSSASSHQ